MKEPRPIEYYPPSDDAVRRVVEAASVRMAESNDDPGYLDPEVTYGLSAFIKLIGQIAAKHLNEASGGGLFDNPEKRGYP